MDLRRAPGTDTRSRPRRSNRDLLSSTSATMNLTNQIAEHNPADTPDLQPMNVTATTAAEVFASAGRMEIVRIADINIGTRSRKDLGDLEGLATSIRDRGLLQPPVVTRKRELVCGFRRLKACELLGWTEIEVRIFNPDDILLAEHDENEFRKQFTVSERVAIAKAVKE